MLKTYQLVRIGIRERFDQDGIHDAEDGCCRTDANGERQNGSDRERRTAGEPSQRVPQVAPEHIREVLDLHATDLLENESSRRDGLKAVGAISVPTTRPR